MSPEIVDGKPLEDPQAPGTRVIARKGSRWARATMWVDDVGGINVIGLMLSPREATRMATWLMRAIDHAQESKKSTKTGRRAT